MKVSLRLAVSLIFFLLLFIQLARSLSVTCEAGGPYGTGSTVLVTGNVSGEVSNTSNVTVNISKSGTLKAATSTTSDSDGSYYAIFTQTFDIGNYGVGVNASNTTHFAECSDTFEVILQEITTTCEQKTVTVQGNSTYATGTPVASGNIFMSIEGTTASSLTSFSGGTFSASLTACVYLGKKYTLIISVADASGKKGTAHILFVPT